jgi:hypothetical protein
VSDQPDPSTRGPQLTPGSERRRSQRVMIRIPVKLYFTEEAKPQTLEARSVVVNDHGALLICSRVFPTGTKMEVENLRNGRRHAGRVLRVPRITELGFEVPVEFDAPAPGFWGIAFPPENWAPGTG